MMQRAPQRRPGLRLFGKLLLAQCAAMALAISITTLLLRAQGALPPTASPEPFAGLPLPMLPTLISLVVVVVTGAALAWYLSQPLRLLSWALHRLADGHLDTRVGSLMKGRRDEIADLAKDFDRMADELQAQVTSRRQLLHDVSHELRSPLSRLQAAIGLMRQEPAQATALTHRIEREAQRMDMLIGEMLMLHRLSADTGPEPARSRVDVIELLQAIADDADFEARAHDREVHIEAPGQFIAEVDGEALYSAYENVIRNAVKFTAPQSIVKIDARVDAQGTLVTCVRDRGPGVPAALLERIFEPFVRAPGSEGHEGTGLGLAIAQRAMARHGGHIDATPRPGGGLVVTLRLPAPSGSAGPAVH